MSDGYKIPLKDEMFELLEDLNQNLVAGSVFYVYEIERNPRRHIASRRDRIIIKFPVKENKGSPIKYGQNDGKPYVQYESLSSEEFNELKFKVYNASE